jgi:SAM-dependent methyltransferase
MQKDVAQRLIDLNLRFYQSFAQPFSDTRARLQPGVLRVLQTVPQDANILDLGCGNGELASELSERGHQGNYLGLDFSEDLLKIARMKTAEINTSFQQGDLTSPDWSKGLQAQHFDIIFAFATLHHIPSRDLRLQLLEQVRKLLSPNGHFVHSNWQFLNSERLRARIQDWSLIELTAEDVDEGDYLLDWRREGQVLRYVHHLSAEDLSDLAASSNFEIVESFSSDGQSGDLGLYQTWQPK